MASSVKVGANIVACMRISADELFIRLHYHDLILHSAENERSALTFCQKFSTEIN
jgi:hypothetical protein